VHIDEDGTIICLSDDEHLTYRIINTQDCKIESSLAFPEDFQVILESFTGERQNFAANLIGKQVEATVYRAHNGLMYAVIRDCFKRQDIRRFISGDHINTSICQVQESRFKTHRYERPNIKLETSSWKYQIYLVSLPAYSRPSNSKEHRALISPNKLHTGDYIAVWTPPWLPAIDCCTLQSDKVYCGREFDKKEACPLLVYQRTLCPDKCSGDRELILEATTTRKMLLQSIDLDGHSMKLVDSITEFTVPTPPHLSISDPGSIVWYTSSENQDEGQLVDIQNPASFVELQNHFRTYIPDPPMTKTRRVLFYDEHNVQLESLESTHSGEPAKNYSIARNFKPVELTDRTYADCYILRNHVFLSMTNRPSTKPSSDIKPAARLSTPPLPTIRMILMQNKKEKYTVLYKLDEVAIRGTFSRHLRLEVRSLNLSVQPGVIVDRNNNIYECTCKDLHTRFGLDIRQSPVLDFGRTQDFWKNSRILFGAHFLKNRTRGDMIVYQSFGTGVGSINDGEDYGIYGYIPKKPQTVKKPQTDSEKMNRKKRYQAILSLSDEFEKFGQKWSSRQTLTEDDTKHIDDHFDSVMRRSRRFLKEIKNGGIDATASDLADVVTK